MKNRQTKLVILLAMLFAVALYGLSLHFQSAETAPANTPPLTFQAGMSFKLTDENSIRLSQNRIKHILYGDQSGGGHKHGQNKPCKSEFPADWNDEKIIATINEIATDENTDWKQQENGYLVSDTTVENLKIRVVIDMDKPEIITAYPTNVPRNPCKAANDNKP